MIDNKRNIKIKVADFVFDFVVKSEKEEIIYRQAEKEIRERISVLEQNYETSQKEILAMCLLSFVSEEISKRLDYQEAIKEIEKINEQITKEIAL